MSFFLLIFVGFSSLYQQLSIAVLSEVFVCQCEISQVRTLSETRRCEKVDGQFGSDSRPYGPLAARLIRDTAVIEQIPQHRATRGECICLRVNNS